MAAERVYWVAWLRHRGGQHGSMFQGRPSLSDFGRWSSRYHAEADDGRLMCGREIPKPHHCYRYHHLGDPEAPTGGGFRKPQGKCGSCVRALARRAA